MNGKRLYFSIMVILCSMAIFLPNAHAVFIEFDLLDDNIQVGETFDVKVILDQTDLSAFGLIGYGFDVNTAIDAPFSYIGQNMPGDFFDKSDLANPNNVTGSWIGAGFAPDSVWLATLSFNADMVGTGSFGIEGTYDGFFYGLFYLDPFIEESILAELEITVQPIPEPSTVLLLATGLVGLAAARFKMKKVHRQFVGKFFELIRIEGPAKCC